MTSTTKRFSTDFPKDSIPKCPNCGKTAVPHRIYFRASGESAVRLAVFAADHYLIHRSAHERGITLVLWSYLWDGAYIGQKWFCSFLCAETVLNNFRASFVSSLGLTYSQTVNFKDSMTIQQSGVSPDAIARKVDRSSELIAEAGKLGLVYEWK